jgi:hypothetical protein
MLNCRHCEEEVCFRVMETQFLIFFIASNFNCSLHPF